MNVTLTPVGPSDQPVSANYATVGVAQGIAYVDFGFIEPSALASVVREARGGKPVPESLEAHSWCGSRCPWISSSACSSKCSRSWGEFEAPKERNDAPVTWRLSIGDSQDKTPFCPRWQEKSSLSPFSFHSTNLSPWLPSGQTSPYRPKNGNRISQFRSALISFYRQGADAFFTHKCSNDTAEKGSGRR